MDDKDEIQISAIGFVMPDPITVSDDSDCEVVSSRTPGDAEGIILIESSDDDSDDAATIITSPYKPGKHSQQFLYDTSKAAVKSEDKVSSTTDNVTIDEQPINGVTGENSGPAVALLSTQQPVASTSSAADENSACQRAAPLVPEPSYPELSSNTNGTTAKYLLDDVIARVLAAHSHLLSDESVPTSLAPAPTDGTAVTTSDAAFRPWEYVTSVPSSDEHSDNDDGCSPQKKGHIDKPGVSRSHVDDSAGNVASTSTTATTGNGSVPSVTADDADQLADKRLKNGTGCNGSSNNDEVVPGKKTTIRYKKCDESFSSTDIMKAHNCVSDSPEKCGHGKGSKCKRITCEQCTRRFNKRSAHEQHSCIVKMEDNAREEVTAANASNVSFMSVERCMQEIIGCDRCSKQFKTNIEFFNHTCTPVVNMVAESSNDSYAEVEAATTMQPQIREATYGVASTEKMFHCFSCGALFVAAQHDLHKDGKCIDALEIDVPFPLSDGAGSSCATDMSQVYRQQMALAGQVVQQVSAELSNGTHMRISNVTSIPVASGDKRKRPRCKAKESTPTNILANVSNVPVSNNKKNPSAQNSPNSSNNEAAAVVPDGAKGADMTAVAANAQPLVPTAKPPVPKPGQQNGARSDDTENTENSYLCKTCKDPFQSAEDLAKHELWHLKNRPFLCKICKKSFASEPHLAVHMNSHLKHKPYECKYCHKRYPTPHRLKEHIVRHEKPPPFVCKYCSAGFYKPHDIERHEMIHTGERPVACPMCPRRFITKSSLSNHVLKAH